MTGTPGGTDAGYNAAPDDKPTVPVAPNPIEVLAQALGVGTKPETSNDIFFKLLIDLFDPKEHAKAMKDGHKGAVNVNINPNSSLVEQLAQLEKIYLNLVSMRTQAHTPSVSAEHKAFIAEQVEKEFTPHLLRIFHSTIGTTLFTSFEDNSPYQTALADIIAHRSELEKKLEKHYDAIAKLVFVPNGFNNPYADGPLNHRRLLSTTIPVPKLPFDIDEGYTGLTIEKPIPGTKEKEEVPNPKSISTGQLVAKIVAESIKKSKENGTSVTPEDILQTRIEEANQLPEGNEIEKKVKKEKLIIYKYLVDALPWFYFDKIASAFERNRKEIEKERETKLREEKKEADAERAAKATPFDPQTMPAYRFGFRYKQFSDVHLNEIPAEAPHLKDVDDSTKDVEYALLAAMPSGYIIRQNYFARITGEEMQDMQARATQAAIFFAERQLIRKGHGATPGKELFAAKVEKKDAAGNVVKDSDGKTLYVWKPVKHPMDPQQLGARINDQVKQIDSLAEDLQQQLERAAFLKGMGTKITVEGKDLQNSDISETYSIGQDHLFSRRTWTMFVAKHLPAVSYLAVVPLITRILKQSSVSQHIWVSKCSEDEMKKGKKPCSSVSPLEAIMATITVGIFGISAATGAWPSLLASGVAGAATGTAIKTGSLVRQGKKSIKEVDSAGKTPDAEKPTETPEAVKVSEKSTKPHTIFGIIKDHESRTKLLMPAMLGTAIGVSGAGIYNLISVTNNPSLISSVSWGSLGTISTGAIIAVTAVSTVSALASNTMKDGAAKNVAKWVVGGPATILWKVKSALWNKGGKLGKGAVVISTAGTIAVVASWFGLFNKAPAEPDLGPQTGPTPRDVVPAPTAEQAAKEKLYRERFGEPIKAAPHKEEDNWRKKFGDPQIKPSKEELRQRFGKNDSSWRDQINEVQLDNNKGRQV